MLTLCFRCRNHQNGCGYLGCFFNRNQSLCIFCRTDLTTCECQEASFECHREEGVDIRKMMESKRTLCSVDQSSFNSITSNKRHKADLSISTKERKEKIGERIVALQQLVSPFGKSDTASVLLEATHYISFLHKQVKVLSAPYLQCSPTTKTQDVEQYSLRSRGLCLVPVSYTIGVAQSNGADIWAPTKSTSSQVD